MSAEGLFAELKRRRVIRALVGYGLVSFAVLQIIEPVMHGLHWSEAVLSYVVVALALGFPVVVGLAWIFDANAGRIERTSPPAGKLRGVPLVLVSIGLLAAAPGLLYYFVLRRPAPATAHPMPSIAVLPFVNLSSDKEQEYFSDGISEEILNSLTEVEGLRVIGRTSSFSFKGKNEDLRAIGERLNAAHLLEGSVRKSGAHVRITAQLIESAGGTHLWSQQFDRQLTDMFAVQDEIAKAVVAALKVKLLPAQGAAIAEQRTLNPEAHDQYLLGRHFFALGSLAGDSRAIEALEKAVALDPGYAPAWAALARAEFAASNQYPGQHDPSRGFPRSREAAEKSVALAPGFAGGYAVRGSLRAIFDYDWSGASADLERALSLNPRDADVLQLYGSLLARLGKVPEAITATRKAAALDPLSSEVWWQLSVFYLGTGQLDLAETAATRALDLAPERAQAARNLGFAYLLAGRLEDARAAFHRSTNELYRLMGDALVEHQLGHQAEAQRPLDTILANPVYRSGAGYQIAQVYAWQGDADRAFEWLESAYQHHDAGLAYLKYDPLLRKVRNDARYAALLRKMNLPTD